LKPVNATKDFLTNCYTREAFIPFLKKMEEEYLTNKRPFSVLMMDVDHFKSFNDKYGHMLGDEVLKYFSSSLRLDLEDEENVPFRFGGDEFVMVFPNKAANDAYHLAARLRKNIRTRSCLIKGKQISVTFSGGVAAYPADANNIEDVVERADRALYYSKNHGRGRIIRYSDLAQKELLQMLLIIVILLTIGGLFYFYRDNLSSGMGRWYSAASSWLSRPGQQSAQTLPLATPEAPVAPIPEQPTTTADTAPAEPAPEPPPIISEVHLDSGRIVTGIIKHEDTEVVELEVGLQEGKGILQLKKSQIIRIRRGVKPAS